LEEDEISLIPAYYMLFLFSMCGIVNQIGWIAFAPLSSVLQDTYQVSIYTINYLSQSFMIMYLPMNQPAVLALD
jgi:hypothetical protein